MNNATTNRNDDSDLLGSLRITKVSPRTSTPGSWVDGTIGGHTFQALVFPQPAADPAFEIPGSNISKFWLRDAGGNVVAGFDRGWDTEPATELAKRITDLLAAGLAETVYG